MTEAGSPAAWAFWPTVQLHGPDNRSNDSLSKWRSHNLIVRCWFQDHSFARKNPAMENDIQNAPDVFRCLDGIRINFAKYFIEIYFRFSNSASRA